MTAGSTSIATRVRPAKLPQAALLQRYKRPDCYTDCYCCDIDARISHAEFVSRFYCTRLFKAERLVLSLFARSPSSDAQAHALGNGQRDRFAAWTVEARADDQLLMCDLASRTRSWLMTECIDDADQSGTRLYFGSAVVHATQAAGEGRSTSMLFKLLLPAHRLYSVALLSAARRALLSKSSLQPMR